MTWHRSTTKMKKKRRPTNGVGNHQQSSFVELPWLLRLLSPLLKGYYVFLRYTMSNKNKWRGLGLFLNSIQVAAKHVPTLILGGIVDCIGYLHMGTSQIHHPDIEVYLRETRLIVINFKLQQGFCSKITVEGLTSDQRRLSTHILCIYIWANWQ